MDSLTTLLVSLGASTDEYQERLVPHQEASERELAIAMITERVLDLQEQLARATPVPESLAVQALRAIRDRRVAGYNYPWRHAIDASSPADYKYRAVAAWALEQEEVVKKDAMLATVRSSLSEDDRVELERRRIFAKIVIGSVTDAENITPDDWPQKRNTKYWPDYYRVADNWITEQRSDAASVGTTLDEEG